jgi:hypothetical protein
VTYTSGRIKQRLSFPFDETKNNTPTEIVTLEGKRKITRVNAEFPFKTVENYTLTETNYTTKNKEV